MSHEKEGGNGILQREQSKRVKERLRAGQKVVISIFSRQWKWGQRMIDASSNIKKKEQPYEFYILYLDGLEKWALFRGCIINIQYLLHT